jgi:uncharacterized protein (DUF1501 family)
MAETNNTFPQRGGNPNEIRRALNAIEAMGGSDAAASLMMSGTSGPLATLLRQPNVGRKSACAVIVLLEAEGKLDATQVVRASDTTYWREIRRIRGNLGLDGGKAPVESDTVTIRLDPRLNYLAELAGRAQRRSKSSFIQWAVQEALKGVDLRHCPCCGQALPERTGGE